MDRLPETPPAGEMISPPLLERLGRRGFLGSSGAVAGYTLAAGPVMAQTIVTTPADGLVAGDVMIPAGDRDIPGYRARPARGSAWPVVVVCQEIFGLHEYIKDVCRRLAAEGYLAVAPDYYVRQGDPKSAENVQAAAAIAMRKPDDELFRDLDATCAWAASDGGNGEKLAIIGFCRGGRNVWAYAAQNPRLKAGVAWYGPVAGQASALTPRVPLDMAADIKCPILGLYGEADTGIPVEGLRTMETRMREAGKRFTLVIYPGAPHGFHADYRPSYREEPAKAGWRLMLDFLKGNGVA
ncbi:dienelactone hydrolase family protein [Pararoseomonas sp. SCSIO 73927]|uniref:dienelactone hydrolase family protein n=1 Tax=Pararoseomonas sp. SCSIO 73927 TaxID=3114537 RepID=UPI0030CDEBD2